MILADFGEAVKMGLIFGAIGAVIGAIIGAIIHLSKGGKKQDKGDKNK